jgi:hypothetical protein
MPVSLKTTDCFPASSIRNLSIDCFPASSIRNLSISLTGQYRPKLNAVKAEIIQKVSGKCADFLGLQSTSAWVFGGSSSYVHGSSSPAYDLASVNYNVFSRDRQMKYLDVLMLHETLHNFLVERRFLSVRREFPDIWVDVRNAMEQTLTTFELDFPPGVIIQEPEQQDVWVKKRATYFYLKDLKTPEAIAEFIRDDLQNVQAFFSLDYAGQYLRHRNLSPLYVKFWALERATKILSDATLLIGGEKGCIIEEAFNNVLAPWLLDKSFAECLQVFPIDRWKIPATMALHRRYQPRPEKLLQAFSLSGSAVKQFFTQLIQETEI